LLALFPALLFLTSLLGYFAGEDSQLRASLFNYLSAVLPGEASKLISETVNDVTQASGGGKLSFGILATLWAASNGMGAISESLNAAYDLKETRPWWKVRLIAVGLTLALSFLIVSSLVLVLYGHDLADTVAGKFGLSAAFALTWKIVQWPIVFGFVLLAFALIYYFGPDARDQDWKWITPGAFVGVGLWLLVSFAFKTYLSFFNSYSATYGSLGAVIILMLWFYFTGLAILVGGEINSEIENAMAKQGAPDAKEKGEKAPDAGKDSGAKSKGASARGGAPARAASTAPARTDARASRGRVTRMDDHGEGFSLGKAAVVAAAWALSKVGLGRTDKHTR
ncbi:MAG TPA: YihY/virulence factor BrkB family protein, partial [Pyrinomonadaceae bacterium]|nr:YihY/virulence factor BrkB family protein [Pyrinomonadaceae bacterium]